MTLPLPSRFFTFYSFKGGVGRTMALLNCAYILAGAGRSVLMIDFDLEAPGLSFLIGRGIQLGSESRYRKPAKSPLKETNGLVELITAFVNSPQDWPLGQADSDKQLREDYMLELYIPRNVYVKDTKGQLLLLPAGRMDDSYAARLTQIDWKKPPLDKYRDDLFRHVRKLIESLDEFDYIFIDSRTGLTDGSYIAARILADHLIVLTGLNDQNIIGTANFLKHVASWPKEEDRIKERRVILVESPVPVGEEKAKDDRHRRVEELFKHYLGVAVPFSRELPYSPLLAFREEAIVADWPDTPLGRAYRELTRIIQELAEDTPERWVQRILDTLRNLRSTEDRSKLFNLSAVREALETLRPIDPSAFATVTQAVATILADLQVPIKGDTELIEYLVSCHPDDPFYLRQLARMQQIRQRFEDAKRSLDQAVSIAEKQENQSELWQVKMGFVKLLQYENRLAEAREACQQALEIARRLNAGEQISKTLYALANLHSLEGQYEEAKQNFQEALKINQSLDNQPEIATLLLLLASLDRWHGNYKVARQGFKKALEINQALGNQQGIAAARYEFAILDSLQGNSNAAQQNFQEALEINQSFGDRQGIAVILFWLARLNLLQQCYQAACQGFGEALELFQKMGKPRWALFTQLHQGAVEVFQICSGKQGTINQIQQFVLLSDKLNSTDKLRTTIDRLYSNLEKIRAIGAPHHWIAQGLLLLAETMLEFDERNESLAKMREAKELCNQYGLAGLEAEADTALALLLAERGDTQTAAEHAKAAIHFFDAQDVNHPDRPALDRLLLPRKPPIKE